MKIELTPPPPAPVAPLTYPVLLESRDGCVKLFVNETDGTVLRIGSKAQVRVQLGLSSTVTGGLVEPHCSAPATNSGYWSRYAGTVTLSN